ncbi:TPA: hypothetical protein ACIU9Q_004512, partial [Salmonella enterica subsp. enterica serovar Virchow]
KAAHNAKVLNPSINKSFSTGWVPPKIINYVVAYDGPAQMNTVYNWILNSHQTNRIPLPSWNQQTKYQTPGTALDGVVLLNKGFIKLDNTPLSLNSSQQSGTHIVVDSNDGNLLM